MINFEEFIDRKVMEDKPLDDDFNDKRFHPSSAGFCERQIFLRKTGLIMFNRYVRGSMLTGTILHQWLQSHIKDKSKVEVEITTELKDKKINPHGVYFKGYADFVNNKICYDFKSTANIKFNSNGIKDYHKDQILVYMAGVNAQKGVIVYIDKRDLSAKQFAVMPSKEKMEEIFLKINRVYEAYLKYKESKDKKIPFEKCDCYFCKDEKLKVIEETCLCGGQANLVYFDHNIPILKCDKCGDEFEAAEA